MYEVRCGSSTCVHIQTKLGLTVSAPMMSICVLAAVRRDRYSLVGMTVRPSPVVNFLAPSTKAESVTGVPLTRDYGDVGKRGKHTDG